MGIPAPPLIYRQERSLAEQVSDDVKEITESCIEFAVKKLGLKEVPQEHADAINAVISDAACYIRKGTIWQDSSPLQDKKLDTPVRAFLDLTVHYFVVNNIAQTCEERNRQWDILYRVDPRD